MTDDKVWDSSTVDFEKSKEIACEVCAKNQACFTNSIYGLMVLADSNAVYVEGYAVSDDFKIVAEHGWIEIAGERIVDPTPVYHGGRTTRRYFPVDRYTRDEVRKQIWKKNHTPFQQMPWKDERWRAVREQADRYSYGDEQYEKLMSFRAQFQKKVVG
jgi:hypothetical protein